MKLGQNLVRILPFFPFLKVRILKFSCGSTVILVGIDCHMVVVIVVLAPDRDQEVIGTDILASMGISILTWVRPHQPVVVSDSVSLLESLWSLFPRDFHLNQNIGLRLLSLCSPLY